MIYSDTIPGKTYAVTTRYGCTVGAPDMPDYILLELDANKQGYFVACSTRVYVTDDTAKVTEVFKAAPIAANAPSAGGGNGGGSTTGEKVVALTSGSLTAKHATWFDNKAQSSISVQAAPWKNEVMTCYLKTAVPVELSGVIWLYGEPAMMEGFTFVVALQQVDASTVLANLAYSLKQ